VCRREQALWALVNISSQSDYCKQDILDMGMCHSLLLLLNITDEQVLSGAYSPFAAGHSQGRVFPTPSLFTMQYAAWMCSNLVRCNHTTLLILICFTIPLICLLYAGTDRYQVKEIYSRSLSWPHCSCNRRYVRDEASYFPFFASHVHSPHRTTLS
jgi:hypothetical protein